MAEEPEGADLAAQQELQEALQSLKGVSIEGVLQAGWEASLRLLVAKVSTGQATHQELAILRNMLRDNGMVLNKVLEGAANKPLPLPGPDELDLPALSKPDYA